MALILGEGVAAALPQHSVRRPQLQRKGDPDDDENQPRNPRERLGET
jgi:hypothetical protein